MYQSTIRNAVVLSKVNIFDRVYGQSVDAGVEGGGVMFHE